MKRTILITGANRGIGLAIAQRLAKDGNSILLGSRDLKSGEEAASPLRRQGFDVTPIHLNLSDLASVDETVANIVKLGQQPDVLVNNAGVYYKKPLLELSNTQIADSLVAHLTGPLHLIGRLVPGMTERGYGRIVNMSSGWGSFTEGMEGPGVYGITKAAMNAMTVRLPKELPSTIKVNAMCPGWVRTRMGGEQAERTPEEGADTAVWLATLPDDGPTGGFFRDRKPIGW